jgi:hypothetical protein
MVLGSSLCKLCARLLYTQHLHTVSNKATAVLCNIFPLLARDLTLTQAKKLTLYKLLIRSILTPPLSAVLRVLPTISNSKLSSQSVSESSVIMPDVLLLPNCTTLNIEPIPIIIHRLKAKFFAHSPSHPNPLGPTNPELCSSRPDYYVQEI